MSERVKEERWVRDAGHRKAWIAYLVLRINALLLPIRVLFETECRSISLQCRTFAVSGSKWQVKRSRCQHIILGLWLMNSASGESSMVPRLDPRSSDQDGRHPACKLTCFLTQFISWCYLKNTTVGCAVHKNPLTLPHKESYQVLSFQGVVRWWWRRPRPPQGVHQPRRRPTKGLHLLWTQISTGP